MKPLHLTTIWMTFVVFLGLAITIKADTINLAWNPNTETDLAGYVVSYGTQPGTYTTTVDVGTNTAQSLSNLVNGVRYYFSVKAYNTSGMSSAASQEISGVAAATGPPTAPAGPIPASGATSVALTTALGWAASTNATQYDVAFGTINPPGVVSSNQTSTTYQPVSLAAGTTYYWRIVAKGPGGSTSGPIWNLTTAVPGSPVLVAAYAFNEGVGTTTGDASGNGRVGGLSNTTWTTAGKYNGALSFDGSSSRVTVADAAALHLSTAMTLEAWVNQSASASEYWQGIIYKGADNYFLAKGLTAGGTIGGGLVVVQSPSALPENTWTHVAVTYDGSMVRLFVNGSQVDSHAATGVLDVSTSPLEIGGSLVDGGWFTGLIDDVRIYATALTAAQIQTDMSTPVASTIVDTQAPTTPTTLAVTAVSTTQLTLTWTASTDNVGVTGYRIERCAGAGCTTFSQVGTASTTSYSDTGLVAATKYSYRVRATDAASNLSSYSSSASATTLTATAPPTAPSSPTPANNVTGVPLTVILSWAASTNATQYDVALGTTNPPAVVSSNQTSTTYQPVALAAGTTYYWQIVAKGAGGSTSGPIWNLTTAVAARPAPVAAYAFNESAGTTTADASGNGRTGTLTNATWTAAGKNGGALSFDGSSSQVTVADAAALHLSTAMTLEAWVNQSASASEYWQGIIYKGADNYFLAKGLTAGGTIGGGLVLVQSPSALPENTWTHVAVTYDGSMMRLFVNGSQVDSHAATGVLDVSTSPLEIGGSVVDGGWFTGLIDDVRVYNVALTAAQIQTDMATPVASTIVDTQAPTTPTTLAVTAVSTTQLTLTWTASTDNVGVTGYRIERCAGAGCTTFSQVGTASTASYSDTGLVAATKYSYRVRATDAASNLSSYSSSASATTLTATTPPTAPSGPTPANNVTGVPLTVILSWAASTNATQYDVAFGTTNPPAVVSSNQTSPTYQPVALTAATKYYWQIVAKGAGGSTSGPMWSFTMLPAPSAPAGPTPASNATGASLTPTLSWAASTNTTQYDVAFGTTNPPTVVVSSNQTSTTYRPAALTAGTTYYWQVVAKGPCGATSGPVWIFKTLLPPAPSVPSGPLPSNGATGVSTTAALSWAVSTNATQYDVAFGTTNPPAVVSSNQTSTAYQPVALKGSKKYYWRIVAKGAGGSTSGPVWSMTTGVAVVARPAPVAAYAFNESAGTTTADASGNGRTGTLTNATWTAAGRNGGALSFNGSSSRVTVADAAALHLSTAMTLEAWVNQSASASEYWQGIIYKGADNYFLAKGLTAGGTIGGGLVLVQSPSALPENTWTHVAVTYDGSMVRLFVNGSQVDSHAATGVLDVSTSPLEIGGSLVDGGWFTGLIDDVRVYNVALTAAQIQTDMATPVANAPQTAALTAAPTAPSGPLPSNGATNVLTMVALNWAASTNAGQYDVAFGTTNPPPTVATNVTTTSYQPATTFGFATTYFWQVTAKSAGGTTSGPVWSFTAQPAAMAPLSSASSELQPLRLMTWNVNGGNNRAGAPNVDAQVALMVSSGAQVIALQGVTISTAGDLSSLYRSKLENATSRTWNALWIPAPRLAPANPEGNLFLTTLPIAGSATTELDSAPINPTLLDAKRSAGWIAVVVNNVTVHIATTQLAVDATQREAQLGQLDGWLATVPTPRLIGGDFNMLPTDATFGHVATGFKDVWTTMAPMGDPGITRNVSSSPVGRFDYWWNELTDQHATPTAIWVLETSRSNHHAVVIDVNVH